MSVPAAMAAAAAVLAATLLAGCPGNGSDGTRDGGYAQTSSKGPIVGSQGSDLPASTSSRPPAGHCPFTSKAAAAAPSPAPALVQVRDGNGALQMGVPLKAMRDWAGYATASSDADGCARFEFQGPGEYQFATDGGGCERQGSAYAEWNGTMELRVSIVVRSVCET